VRPIERTVTFVLADLAGYVALTEAHGNAGAAEVIERLVTLTHAALAPGARLVERAGDQVVVAADDPRAALQTALRLAAGAACEPRFPLVRVAVHAGPVLEQDGAYFGAALNIAARVAAHAQPGQILCTDSLAGAVRELPGVEARLLGPVAFRHVVEPVVLFELVADRAAAEPAGIDPVCFMQVSPEGAAASVRLGEVVYLFCSDACAAAFAQHPEAYLDR
jgi:class 3 adenylate cyclase/YHS domain-containing protein